MSITVVCPQGHRVTVDADAPPPRLRCPQCGEVVTVPAKSWLEEPEERITASPPPPLPGDEERDVDAEKRRRKKKRRQLRERLEGLEKVNLGLAFQYVRLLALIVVMLGWIMLVALSVTPVFGGMRGRDLIFLFRDGPTILAWAVALQTIIGIAGSSLCLFVPQSAGARGIVIAALAVDALAFLMYVVDLAARPVVVIIFLVGLPNLLGILMGLTSWLLFIFFLRQLASFMDEEATARHALELQGRGLALFVAAPIVLLLGGAMLRYVPCIGFLFFLGLVLTYLVFVVKFLFTILEVIGSMRKVIVSREQVSSQSGWLIAGIPSGLCLLALLLSWLVGPGAAPIAGPPRGIQDNPALQKAGERERVANNFKQIGLAFHNFHAVHKHLPKAAIVDDDGNPLLSWRVAILPYVEHDHLYKQFKLDEPWDSPHNKKLLDKMPPIFAPPGSKGSSTFIQVFTGKGTLFEDDKAIRMVDVTDGTSNTLLAVEAGEAVPWTKPDDLSHDPKKPLPKLGGASKDGLHMLFVDGSVRFGRHSFNERIFRLIVTRNDGKIFDLGDLYR